MKLKPLKYAAIGATACLAAFSSVYAQSSGTGAAAGPGAHSNGTTSGTQDERMSGSSPSTGGAAKSNNYGNSNSGSANNGAEHGMNNDSCADRSSASSDSNRRGSTNDARACNNDATGGTSNSSSTVPGASGAGSTGTGR